MSPSFKFLCSRCALGLAPGKARLGQRSRTGGRNAPGRNRTCDLALRRRALYPLSYWRGDAQSTAGNERGRLRAGPFCAKTGNALCAPVQPGVLHAGGLAGSELVVTGVEGVVHVVVDRVETRLRAGVLTLRAAERGDALRR